MILELDIIVVKVVVSRISQLDGLKTRMIWKREKGDCCGFCEHWKLHHKNNFIDLPHVKIYFLDTTDESGTQEDGYQALKTLEGQWMVQLGSLGALDSNQGCNKKDDAKANAWMTWPNLTWLNYAQIT